MKIFHLVSNKVWGGGEQYVYNLACQQLNDGNEVELCCRPTDAVVSKFLALGVPIHRMSLHGITDLKSSLSLARLLKGGGHCVVHAHNFNDSFTACCARILSGNREVRIVTTRHLVRKAKKSFLYRWLYHRIDCLCFVSQTAHDCFFSSKPPMHADKTTVVLNSILLPATIPPADIRHRFPIPSTHLIGMYHGRLHPEKGLDTLLNALALLRDKPLTTILVGNGSDEYTAHLKNKARQMKIDNNVFFAGFHANVLSFVKEADFGILPSSAVESCLLSAQEYMSQGIPVITTNHGGQREYIIHGANGLLVPPDDPHALSQAIALMVNDTQCRLRLGRQAKADFDNKLNFNQMYGKIRQIYTSL